MFLFMTFFFVSFIMLVVYIIFVFTCFIMILNFIFTFTN